MAKKVDYEAIIKRLNSIKPGFDLAKKVFTIKEFRDFLVNIGCPKNDTFYSAVRQTNLIEKVDRHHVRFTKEGPVYIGVLKSIFAIYTKIARNYNNKSVKAIKVEEVVVRDEQLLIQDAIRILKNAGYKILKPMTEYEEV